MDKRDTLAGDKLARKEGGPVAGPAGAEPRPRWPEPMQRGRQAAITRNLHTWSNYKSWAEKVRSTWEPEQKK